MTKFIAEEMLRCKNDIKEFAKYCTDSEVVIQHLELHDIARSIKCILEFGDLQEYAAILALWKSVMHFEDVGIIANPNDPTFTILKHLYHRLPRYLVQSVTADNREQFRFEAGSIRLSRPSPCAMCGCSFNALFFINSSEFNKKTMTEMCESIIPIIASTREGKMYFLEDKDNYTGPCDTYGKSLEVGDNVVVIEDFNRHGHHPKKATIHRIDEDAKGVYIVLIVESNIEQFGSYTKKVYNYGRCIVKVN